MMFRSSVLLLVLSSCFATTTAFTVSPSRTNVARWITFSGGVEVQPIQQKVLPSVHLRNKLFSSATPTNGEDDMEAADHADDETEVVAAAEEPAPAEDDDNNNNSNNDPDNATPVEEDSTIEDVVAAEQNEVVEGNEKESAESKLAALKEEIANYEATLRGKQATLSRIQEDVDKYSKAGYARRVAQMEDMKKIRLSMQSSNKETAKATVVQNFLPVLDDLRALKEVYEEDDFGSKYNGLTGNLATALKELGVEEYTVSVGDAADPQRVTIVEEEYSESVEKGKVIRPVAMGMEIDGNVMRMAKAVVSLGSHSPEEDKADTNEEEVTMMNDYADE